MLSLSANIRKTLGKKVKSLRKKDILPGVLYGPKIKPLPLEIDLKEFEKIYKETGESTLISLEVADLKRKYLVLIHDLEKDPVTEKIIHIDFYQPSLEEEVTAVVPIVFGGESRAVKELGGTLVKNIHELEVKALPQNLPHEIKVDISKLKTFEDDILVKDVILPKEVKILKDPAESIALVTPPEKVEEELVKPIEEKAEEGKEEEGGKVVEEEKSEEEGEEKADEK